MSHQPNNLSRWFGTALSALPETRFRGLPAWFAGLTLAALVAVVGYGLAPRHANVARAPIVAAADGDDIALYDGAARRVAAGENYYAAATAAHRAAGYPLRPFVTVRLPSLALIEAGLGAALVPALWGLTLAAWIATAHRLRRDHGPGRFSIYASALMGLGLAPALVPASAHWHEPWAAVLIALSLALRTRDSWILSVAIGLIAVSIRELALPYLCVMAVAAFSEGRRQESVAWVAAIAAFAGLMVAHALMLSAHVAAADLHSPGWGGFGGWRFILDMAAHFTGFAVLGPGVGVAVPLALLGWAAWPGEFGRRGALLVFGYVAAFMVVGQSYNVYWGMMLTPLLPVGLVFAPSALRDLSAAAKGLAAGRPAFSA